MPPHSKKSNNTDQGQIVSFPQRNNHLRAGPRRPLNKRGKFLVCCAIRPEPMTSRIGSFCDSDLRVLAFV